VKTSDNSENIKMEDLKEILRKAKNSMEDAKREEKYSTANLSGAAERADLAKANYFALKAIYHQNEAIIELLKENLGK